MPRCKISAQAPCRVFRPLALAAWLACQASPTLHAQTLPGTATVTNGVVDVQRFTNGVQVTNTPGAIIHWDRFSIGAGNTVRFVQQNAGSAVLNRVTGNTPSQIHGALQSNGRVFLLNPNGILFGAGARVDVAGLLASTLDIRDQDFLDGKYEFKCFNAIACEAGVDSLNPYNNRVVLEDGSQITTRTAGEGGQVWLIARDRVITEKGSRIEAPSGQVMAATAREVSISSPVLGQMRFTLTGTAGSRIDLAGDIDVPRGAAGFFADSIRFAGLVRARSEVGAAGQIVASAAANLVVDADARLDVSGTSRADAGAVRLAATQQITVSAAAEIAADGGSFTAQGAGGMGGLIELSAAAVVVPGVLGDDRDSPVQLHARGSGAQGLDLARYGRVDILESGSFVYDVLSGPVLTGGSVSTVSSRTGVGHGSGLTLADVDQTRVEAIIPAGDGSFLVLTLRTDLQDSRDVNSSASLSTSDVRRTEANIHTALLIGADGQLLRSQTLGRSDYSRQEFSSSQGLPTVNESATPFLYYTAVGLSKGGWAVMETGGAQQRVLFLQAGVASPVSVGVADGATLRPLLGGGVLVQATVNGELQRQVFDSLGRAVTDVAAALAGENLYAPQSNTSVAFTPVDERRGWRTQAAGVLQYVDRLDNTVERSAQTSPAIQAIHAGLNGALVGSAATTTIGSGTVRTDTTPIGIWEGTAFTPLADTRYQLRDVSAGNREDTVFSDSGPGFFRALNSGAMAMLQFEETVNNQGLRVPNAGPNLETYERRSTVDTRNTIQVLTRRLQTTPFATTGTEGAFVAPVLLASQAGLTNGVRGGIATPTPDLQPPPVLEPTPTPKPTLTQQGPAPVPATPEPPPGPVATPTEPTAPPVGDIPPPPYQPATRPAGATAPVPGLGVIDVAKLRTGDVRGGNRTQVTGEFLESAREIVRNSLGDAAEKDFVAGNDQQRRQILDEVMWVNMIDEPEMVEATRSMGRDMRGAMLNVLAGLQRYETLEAPALQAGLRKALSVKREGPTPDDGSAPTRARTALELELEILEGELHQAVRERMRADSFDEAARKKADDAQKRVSGKITRALVIAAREEAGETVDDTGDIELGGDDQFSVRVTEAGEIVQARR